MKEREILDRVEVFWMLGNTVNAILGCGDCILGSVGVEGRVWRGEVLGAAGGVRDGREKCRKKQFFPDRCFLVRVRSRIDPVLVWCNLSVFGVVFDAIWRLLG